MVFTRRLDLIEAVSFSMYAELQTASNFSFLRGASHPHELMWRAAELGYKAVALTDYNTLSGIVRAHAAAREAGIQCIVGCRLEVDFQGEIRSDVKLSPYQRSSLLVYPRDKKSYGTLCRLITHGKRDVSKSEFFLPLSHFLPVQNEFVTILVPPFYQTPLQSVGGLGYDHYSVNARHAVFYELCKIVKDNCTDPHLLSLALTYNYGSRNRELVELSRQVARALSITPVATNDVHYHIPERKPLQDVLTCIREHCTLQQAGFRLFQNSERFLKPVSEMVRLFREIPHAISRTCEIAEMTSGFSLSSLTYTYPEEICPNHKRPEEHLREAVMAGAQARYPSGIPPRVVENIEQELRLIRELDYEKYFLTCYDIVNFARSRGILCQGRGAAANSSVCFCLGITSVDPMQIDLLFARFISKERQEPPDIDIDFEHERREEVIQYIYQRFGRERAAIAAEVVTYRARSAVREVGKALGLSLEVVDKLAKSVHRWTGCAITSETLREIGLNPFDPTVQNTVALSHQLIGFPRHLSQHVGGFIISHDPLCEIVPIINAGMENRTIIEWDKNDIEELGMLKIDVLALGMLTCIRKALALINSLHGTQYELHSIPAEDPAVYDMLCASDSVGVFQVESRAQMSMLPRLKPRCFYDLVIEVAIVRPGPIQGNMVHPFLRRRAGFEKPYFPDQRVAAILGKTLGVPIFQEQAMRLAITLANFSPGEAEQLRRAMAAWKTHVGVIEAFKEKIVRGMKENGYSEEFAETCLNQIKGFSEYGFPESHAASFALLVYASAWIKCHYPAEFAASLINSQPMGFYAPSQIVRDAEAHGVTVERIDANKSAWNCTVEYSGDSTPHLQLGLRLISGLRRDHAHALENSSSQSTSISDLRSKVPTLMPSTLKTLARADSFSSFNLSRRSAQWQIQELPQTPGPLDALFTARSDTPVTLPQTTWQRDMFDDYATTGLSLRAHPVQCVRTILESKGAKTTTDLLSKNGIPVGTRVTTGGLAITRQRPGTAKGVVFITLEDEWGSLNLIIRPALFERYSTIVMSASLLCVKGSLQRIGEVIYIEVDDITSLDTFLRHTSTNPYFSRSSLRSP
jgi:error-prone DNA polymerase